MRDVVKAPSTRGRDKGSSILWLLLPMTVLLASCASSARVGVPPHALADDEATRETRALFANLKRLSGEAVLFGHHDALAYGVDWVGEEGRSDVKEVSGSYPAVYGWDVSRLFTPGRPDVPDAERTAQLREWILEGYGRGGVATLCWHMANPITDGSFYDTTRAVYALLPGGSHHEDYKSKLDVVADFFNSLRMEPRGLFGRSELAPVIFRPFHEHTGSWFWWGQRHATEEEFEALWRFTVEYLRDEKDVHNVLYSYSTDVFDSPEKYLERYPGDEYIDVLGYDDYQSIRTPETRETFTKRLRTLVGLAEAKGKVAALTETGVEGVPDPTWWTRTLLEGIKADSVGRGIAYVMVWRNAHDREGHFYAPHPGHPSAADFVRFKSDPFVLFEDELPDLYSLD